MRLIRGSILCQEVGSVKSTLRPVRRFPLRRHVLGAVDICRAEPKIFKVQNCFFFNKLNKLYINKCVIIKPLFYLGNSAR